MLYLGALDLLSWTRMHWAWILKPSIPWKDTENTLKSLPPAFAVVDCKSFIRLVAKDLDSTVFRVQDPFGSISDQRQTERRSHHKMGA